MSSTAPAEVTGGAGGNILAVLQRVGRSLIMPIVVLPPAALLLRLGQPDLLGRSELGWLDAIADVISASGQAVFDALPLLFAVGVAIGFARRSDGSTALAAVVGYLVFHYVSMNMFFHNFADDSRVKANITKALFDPENPGQPNNVVDYGAQNPTVALGGIVIGIVTALLY